MSGNGRDAFARYIEGMRLRLDGKNNTGATYFAALGELYADGNDALPGVLLFHLERFLGENRPMALEMLAALIEAARAGDYERGWRDARVATMAQACAPVFAGEGAGEADELPPFLRDLEARDRARMPWGAPMFRSPWGVSVQDLAAPCDRERSNGAVPGNGVGLVPA